MACQALYETIFLHIGIIKYHFCNLFLIPFQLKCNLPHLRFTFGAKSNSQILPFKNLYRCFFMMYTKVAIKALHKTFILQVGGVKSCCCMLFFILFQLHSNSQNLSCHFDAKNKFQILLILEST